MNARTLNLDSGVIVYDSDLFPEGPDQLTVDWFRPDWWEERGLVVSSQQGRGSALVIDAPVGRAVLRQYLRGGWPAKLVYARYLFTGFDRSRPVREFRVLEQLADLELPAPRPVAALCERHGLSASGALITLEIERARPLEQVMYKLDADAWRALGTCLRHFHDYGVVHADLTVRNILYQKGGAFYLVDFDRARIRNPGAAVFCASLKRLRRSLVKAWQARKGDTEQQAWMHLLQGYEQSPRSG